MTGYWLSRNDLKIELWRGRTYEPGSPLCDVCGESLVTGNATCDMHESIVRKGVAMGWSKEDRMKISVPCNCHLVHHGKCHERAHADPDLMVAIQVARYGMQHIREWIATLPFRVPFSWHRGYDDRTARLTVERRAPWILRQNRSRFVSRY